MTEFETLLLKQLEKLNKRLEYLERFGGSPTALNIPLSKPSKDYFLFDWLKEWFNTEYKDSVSKNTHFRDTGVLKNHVFNKPEYNKPLSAFTRNDLSNLFNSIVSTNQRNITSGLLFGALRFAYNNGLMAKDLTHNFKKPKHIQKEDRALTLAEEKQFINALKGQKLEPLILLYLYSGLRRGEALGLERRHIDFEKNEIHVEQQRTPKNKIVNRLKTPKSRRIVKMFPWLKEVLLPFKDYAPNTRLFNYSCNYLTLWFKNFCKEQNIKDFTIKSCRTTFATRCEEMGVPDIVIQSWLGHTTLKMTKQHYIKVNLDFIQSEFDKAIKRKDKDS